MSFGEGVDPGALGWVRAELEETLKQARQALEAYVEDPADTAQLQFCASYLHQVRGTLQMLELYGAAMLAEEMERVVQALLEDRVGQREDAYEVLMRALLQLPDYLERLQAGGRDLPVVLLPILNDLRATRGENLLSENALFNPDLSVEVPVEPAAPAPLPAPELAPRARSLRHMLQRGLLAWYRGQDGAAGLELMERALEGLQAACRPGNATRLWWAARGVVEALRDGGLETNVSLKLLLGQLDRQVRRIIEHGQDALEAEPPVELLKNLLYYVARASSRGPLVSAIQEAFRLGELLPDEEELEAAREALSGHNRQLLETVAAAIREDLGQVKDALDLIGRTGRASEQALSDMAEVLRRVSDTLAMLGLGAAREQVQAQIERLEALREEGGRPDPQALMDMADALLRVETSLEEGLAARETRPAGAEEERASAPLPEGEFRAVQAAVVREATADLAKAKEAIVGFIEAPWDHERLTHVPALFREVRGGLLMLGLGRAAAALEAVDRYVREDLLERRVVPEKEALDHLADAITAVEYYLEAVSEGRTDRDRILATAEAAVAALGHPVAPAEEAAAGEEVPAAEGETPAEAGAEPAQAGEPAPADEAVPDEETAAREADEPPAVEEIELTAPGAVDEAGEPVAGEGEAAAEPGEEAASGVEADDAGEALAGAAAGDEAADEEAPADGPPEEEARGAAEAAAQPLHAPDTGEPLEVLAGEVEPDILDIFIEEAEEELATLRELVPRWRSNPDDRDALVTVRRAFHTLKGSGRLVGAQVVGEFAWCFENMLNRVIDGTIGTSPALLDLLDEALEVLPQLIEQLRGGPAPQADVQSLLDRAHRLAKGEAVEAGPPAYAPVAEEAAATVVEEGAQAAAAAEPAAPAMDPTLYEIFSKESATHLAAVQDFLDACAGGDEAACRPTDALVRALHTLHGSARMAGADAVAEVAGLAERYVKAVQARQVPLPPEGREALAEAAGTIGRMVAALGPDGGPMPEAGTLLERLGALHAREQEALEAEETGEAAGATASSGEKAAVGGTEGAHDDLLEIFLEEGAEILDTSEMLLHRWHQEHESPDVVRQLQRELHTLKGGARMAGIEAIGNLAHALESLFTAVADGHVPVSERLLDTVQRAFDALHRMLEEARAQRPVAAAEAILQEVENVRLGTAALSDENAAAVAGEEAAAGEAAEEAAEGGPAGGPEGEAGEAQEAVAAGGEARAEPPEPAAPPAEAGKEAGGGAEVVPLRPRGGEAEEREPGPPVERRARPRIHYETVRVRADLLDQLVNLAGEISIYRSRLEQQFGAFRFNLAELEQTVARLREQLRRLEIETEAQILATYQTEAGALREDFDPLELDRYSAVQELSRALAESLNDLVSIQGLLENLTRESETLLLQQSRVTTDLQEGLMRTRMVPFSGLVPRMRRIVRQAAEELGKKAELSVSGADAELDRTVLDRVTAPLEHMLRNAVSHGIEPPEERRRRGKDEVGRVHVAIAREGNEVVIRVSDDGAGMDLAAIRRKAVERGLLAPDARVDDDDLVRFIFESGFSTAAEVTQVAGRGVGMDVVNAEVKQLGGSLDIASRPGQGTTFTIRLPFTLAVSRALLVHVGEDVFAVPLASVEGVVRMERDTLERFYGEGGEGLTYEYAGNRYRVEYLGRLLGTCDPVLGGERARFPVLLARAGEHRMALQVDAIMGAREIVVKSVGPQIATVRGIAGATILGDGRVVLILDIGPLVRMGGTVTVHVPPAEEAAEEAQPTTVMVVDDSITMRRVTARLLERNQMQVVTAKDGVDALAKLQETVPDVILLDIEMPRMDGYELATHIRNEERLRHIPIIMITSRTGAKHRERAAEIGVDRYLGKPYQEAELLESIEAVLRERHGHA